jgi:integrase
MGKSLEGKELGDGIQQRQDGLYQARFINRFGKRQTIYAKTLKEIKKKLDDAKFADKQGINIVNSNMTLDEWFDKWLDIYKMNCRNNTKETYRRHYKRIQDDLGWRKLNKLDITTIQEAFNKLRSDNERKNSKKILSAMLDKAVESDLLVKNVALHINTVVSKEDKKERRVLTADEERLFLEESIGKWYYNLFVVALETGMRIGELGGLQWSDIDFCKKGKSVAHVGNSMTYFENQDGKYVYELHNTKTNKNRDIPLSSKAVQALQQQKFVKQSLVNKGKLPLDGYSELVFVTRNNRPITQFLVSECIDGVVKNINKKYPDKAFERVTPHTFRHTFATRLMEANIPMKTIAKLLGHKQLQMTTDLYTHVSDDLLYEAVAQYEKKSAIG